MPSQLTDRSKTRLSPPVVREDVLVRTRLIKRLQKHPNRAITPIYASASSGKTTLVTQWLRASTRRVAWLSVTPMLHEEMKEGVAPTFIKRVLI